MGAAGDGEVSEEEEERKVNELLAITYNVGLYRRCGIDVHCWGRERQGDLVSEFNGRYCNVMGFNDVDFAGSLNYDLLICPFINNLCFAATKRLR